MKRREFLEMTAMAGALLQRRGGARRAADNRWHFGLDAGHRWSLSRGGVVPVRGAQISVELTGEAPVPLAQLDDVRRLRTGSRRTGESVWTVIGRLHGVEVTAEFEDDVRPRILVHLRGLEAPKGLAAVHFTGGVNVPQRYAWINGYQSWSGCETVALDAHTAATGYWQLALFSEQTLRRAGAQDLAFVFGEDDGSAGEFHFTGRSLDAAGRFGHRVIGADQSPATCTLGILPGGDPLAALGADAAARIGPLRAGQTPAGWCSWYELYARVTEDDVLASVDVAQSRFDQRAFRVIQVDDGYQRAAGDWETNDKFPHGHRWLTDRIHAAGLEAGLWMAPFAVTARSGIPAIHPEWLLEGEDGRPLPMDDQPHWGGQSFALDASQRVVQDWLRDLARLAVGDWGYDYLKLDFLHYAARGTRPGRAASGHEALRAGLRALRAGAGHAFVLGCGAPLQHSLGLVDGMRIGQDVDASWGGLAPGAIAAMQRAHLHGRAWRNDPDALLVREPLTIDEARAWVSVIALSGQMTLASDRLDRLPPERLELLMRAMPAQPVRGRALDLVAAPPVSAPALLAGGRAAVRLPAQWRFQAGDEPVWSDPAFDDSSWETIEVGKPWERAGHPGLDGFAWYRTTFTAPPRAVPGPVSLSLGAIDDVDETFLNGVRVGATGTLPPDYHADWQTFRRYGIDKDAVRWGEPNVVAVRVYDGGGDGGMWKLTPDAPPGQILAHPREDWWMLGLVNWDDAEKRMSADLAGAGVSGTLAAWDVWTGARGPDVSGRVSLSVPARSATVLSLRRPRRVPFVLGSSRHVVQSFDIDSEEWDARRRTLSGKSVGLDGRPYALTLALPPGFKAKECQANVGCSIAEAAARAVRLEFTGTKDDIGWSVQF